MTKRLLFVCLGNICRSPAAEGVFLKLIKERGVQDKFLIDSAGTGGWHVGSLPDDRMVRAAKRRGIVLNSKARQITIEDLISFDLILTMDQDNFRFVMNLSKEVGNSLKASVEPLLSYSENTDLKSVPDPYYGGKEGFDNVLDLLNDACIGLLNKLLN